MCTEDGNLFIINMEWFEKEFIPLKDDEPEEKKNKAEKKAKARVDAIKTMLARSSIILNEREDKTEKMLKAKKALGFI